MPRPFNIAFFGTDQFSIFSLRALVLKSRRNPGLVSEITVFTPPDAPYGRGRRLIKPAPLKLEACNFGLSVHHPPPQRFGDWELPPTNSNAPYNLAVAVSFGYFLPKRILSAFCYGGVNVHPSLLPKYRGAAPIIHTLWNGDPVTGVTIQNLSVEQFDAGRILNQQETPVSPTEDYLSLHNRLGEKGADMLVETIELWDHFQSHSWEQDPSKVSYAPKLDRSFSFVDWESDSPAKIMRRHLALGWRYPLASYFRGSVIQLFGVSLVRCQPSLSCPGTISIEPGREAILIRLSDPSYQLRVTGIKLPYKTLLTINDFINGYQFADCSERLSSWR